MSEPVATSLDELTVEPIVRCKACGLIFPGDVRVETWEDHWTTLHGDPPAELDLLFRDAAGVLYEIDPE